MNTLSNFNAMATFIPSDFTKPNSQNSVREYKFTAKDQAKALQMARLAGFSGEPITTYTSTTFTTLSFYGFMTESEIIKAQKKINKAKNSLGTRLTRFLNSLA